MATSSVRALVVDDFERFRRFVASVLQELPTVQVICEASDGLEAVQKAEELQPDLIVLDIGLPKLNGLEAARQIRQLSPNSKILFLSQESSAEVVQEALGFRAFAYVVKSDAGSELLTSVKAVLRGEKFVSGRFAGRDSAGTSDAPGRESLHRNNAARSFGNIHFKLSRARG